MCLESFLFFCQTLICWHVREDDTALWPALKESPPDFFQQWIISFVDHVFTVLGEERLQEISLVFCRPLVAHLITELFNI